MALKSKSGMIIELYPFNGAINERAVGYFKGMMASIVRDNKIMILACDKGCVVCEI